ncbi:MAG: 3-deoxy-7-phosphoheptulonate synthase, partial [Planctomycetota bacterium]
MFIVLRPGCSPEERDNLIRAIEAVGLSVEISEGHYRVVLGVVGDEDRLRDIPLVRFPGVEKVVPLKAPYDLASREAQPKDTVVRVGGAEIG